VWAFALALGCAPAAAQLDGWEAVKVTDKKKPTVYRFEKDGGRQVLHAVSQGSASSLMRPAGFNLAERPLLNWSWKISRLIATADNSRALREDAPARLILVFDGDVAKLPARDRAAISLLGRVSGRELPYATLMYIWGNRAALETVIANPYTRRVQMIVVANEWVGVGGWHRLQRDALADYRNAFKEEPGKLLAYGVMTDTDNTGEYTEAWYADIDFQPVSAALRPRSTSIPARSARPITK
jgi:hypothetical protein